MEPVAVEVRRAQAGPTSDDLARDIERAETIATLMDAQFDVAGLKFGLDAIIGLVPVAGDLVSTLIGFYPIAIAQKHNLGKTVIARMMLNLGLDFVVGSVPLIGDALDVINRANLKNIALLKKAAAKRSAKMSSE